MELQEAEEDQNVNGLAQTLLSFYAAKGAKKK
jgi:hypothetical protein